MSPEESIKETADIKVTVSETGPAGRTLDVEVGAGDVTVEYEKACRKYARSLKVPGFRKGKVPLHIIKQRFGREIEQETVEHAIEHAMAQALRDLKPRPLQMPSLKDYKYKHGEPLTFTAEYEVMPKVEVQGTKGIKVKEEEPRVTDSMITETIDGLRERAARFDPVEGRGVHPGDHVVMDVAAKESGSTSQMFQRENLLIEIGSGGPHPELSDPMRDMKPGETREFHIDYPEDHPGQDMAGRPVDYTVTLHEIKEKVLPDLDDEFARDLGKFETLDELRNRIKDDLMARERKRVREEARRKVIDELMERNRDVPAPGILVDEEIDRRLQEVARSLAMQGVDPESRNVDWEEIRRKQQDPAAQAVKATILLDAIADEQKISLEADSLDKAIEEEAERRQQTPDSLKAQLEKDGRLEKLSEHLVREMVLDFLLGTSNT